MGTLVNLDVTGSRDWTAAVKGIEKLDLAILNAGVEFRDPAAF